MARRSKAILGGLMLLAVLVAGPASAQAATVFGSGSSAMQPYFEVLAAAYKKVEPSTKLVYTANNGNAGAKDVQDGKSAFAFQTRPPLPSDSGLSYSKLFLDGLCVAVNPANSVNNLTIAQVRDIFLANVTEWGAVPGSNQRSPISAFGRNSTAGLYTFFQSAVLGGLTQATNVTQLDKDGEVAVALSRNNAGIGYVGLANSGPGSGVKRLKLEGQPCQASAIKTLKYPLSRYGWIVLPASKPNKAATRFGDWIRTSYAAGLVIAKAGAVPAFNARSPPKKKPKKKAKKK
jgi:phosphate transport system substrate-binding protein